VFFSQGRFKLDLILREYLHKGCVLTYPSNELGAYHNSLSPSIQQNKPTYSMGYTLGSVNNKYSTLKDCNVQKYQQLYKNII